LKNLSDIEINKASFSIVATCIPKTLILMEYLTNWTLTVTMTEFLIILKPKGHAFIAYSTVDVNKDGLSDAFGTGLNPC
jgi:hypothetical protein